MSFRRRRSSRLFRAGSTLALLALVLATLLPYDRPSQRWVQSDSGDWFQVTELAGWLCLPGTLTPLGDQGSGDGFDPFCGLCIIGGSLTPTVPDPMPFVLPAGCRTGPGLWPETLVADHRPDERPPARAPPLLLRST